MHLESNWVSNPFQEHDITMSFISCTCVYCCYGGSGGVVGRVYIIVSEPDPSHGEEEGILHSSCPQAGMLT